MRGLTPQEVTELAHMAGPNAGTSIGYWTDAEFDVTEGMRSQGRVSLRLEQDEEGDLLHHWRITEQGRRALALWLRLTASGVLP